MNKLTFFILATSVLFGASQYKGSTTAAVTLAGGMIKAQNTAVDKKYPRKSCPICKGTGKYWSGDGIKQVDCGYCEPEKTQEIKESQVVHPPVIISSGKCNGPNCRIR
jgi:Zn ribbon nucleic-acid-binding protein